MKRIKRWNLYRQIILKRLIQFNIRILNIRRRGSKVGEREGKGGAWETQFYLKYIILWHVISRQYWNTQYVFIRDIGDTRKLSCLSICRSQRNYSNGISWALSFFTADLLDFLYKNFLLRIHQKELFFFFARLIILKISLVDNLKGLTIYQPWFLSVRSTLLEFAFQLFVVLRQKFKSNFFCYSRY